mmetsp:Transcript_2254/g.5418  ORF Transcript_2254/g.5418 Transcript_2254/m.5418 type:complete len:244 (-) Transcript_2254:30-761(-)
MDLTTLSLALLTSSDPIKAWTALKVRLGICLNSPLLTSFFPSLTSWTGAFESSLEIWWAWCEAACWTSLALSRASCWMCSMMRADALEMSPCSCSSWCCVKVTALRMASLLALVRASPRFPPRTCVEAYPRAAPISRGELIAAVPRTADPARTVPTISPLAAAVSGAPILDSAFSILELMTLEMSSQSGCWAAAAAAVDCAASSKDAGSGLASLKTIAGGAEAAAAVSSTRDDSRAALSAASY